MFTARGGGVTVRRRRLLSLLTTGALVAGLSAVAGLPAQASPTGPSPSDGLQRSTRAAPDDDDVTIRRDDQGRVRSVRTTAGRPVDRPTGVTASTAPEQAARAHLKRYGTTLGLHDQATDLDVAATTARAGDAEIVRFQQQVDGVPVLGGDLVVALDGANNLQSITGETTVGAPAPASPKVSADTARATALRVAAKAHPQSSALTAGEPERWIYDPTLLGAPGRPVGRQVWRVEVTAGEYGDVRELVLVDAATGAVPLHFNQVAEAKNRWVCDGVNFRRSPSQEVCPDTIPASRVRAEGGAANLEADVNKAYDYSGDTYDFYFGRVGRDSLDGAGMQIRSMVRYCEKPTFIPCPYPNAFWNGFGMVYGAGFAGADDVVGHELTHGVIEHTAGLFYVYQSGAVNESVADVMGELIDITNGSGTDASNYR
ncbi:MAG: hypothetical protein GEU96_12700, partial [Propionibacteriales bacterium]|nr:hypothetical protein [Propionibacteriales bacterium]